MRCIGFTFLVTAIAIFWLKKEDSISSDNLKLNSEENLTVKETYAALWNILKLPAIRKLIPILIFCEVNDHYKKFRDNSKNK